MVCRWKQWSYHHINYKSYIWICCTNQYDLQFIKLKNIMQLQYGKYLKLVNIQMFIMIIQGKQLTGLYVIIYFFIVVIWCFLLLYFICITVFGFHIVNTLNKNKYDVREDNNMKFRLIRIKMTSPTQGVTLTNKIKITLTAPIVYKIVMNPNPTNDISHNNNNNDSGINKKIQLGQKRS